MSQTELIVENWMDILPPDYQVFQITSNSFDQVLLGIYAQIKKLFPDVWVNFRNGIRMNNWCGYRTEACAIGAPRSGHRFGAALDLHSSQLKELRWWCQSPLGREAGIMRVEAEQCTPSWVHIDTLEPNPKLWKDKTRPYVFYPY